MAKTVLITGCSSGFGRSAALQFRQEGWRVAATMRDPSAWSDARSDALMVLPLDVESDASVDAAIDATLAHFGTLDCVVNNAGKATASVFEATSIDAAKQIFETNVFGVMRVMQKVLPHFRAVGGGRFVNVGSASAISPDTLMSIYGASKWAAAGLAEGLRYELTQFGVDLKLVEPGFVGETKFLQNTLDNGKATIVPDAYRDFFDAALRAFFEDTPFTFATIEQVAQTIVAAATDDTGTFRFVVGEDARASAFMRRSTSEDAYDGWAWLRHQQGAAAGAERYRSLARAQAGLAQAAGSHKHSREV